ANRRPLQSDSEWPAGSEEPRLQISTRILRQAFCRRSMVDARSPWHDCKDIYRTGSGCATDFELVSNSTDQRTQNESRHRIRIMDAWFSSSQPVAHPRVPAT